MGLVLLAKMRGILPSAADVLAELHAAGFYLSPELHSYVLSLAGEAPQA